MSPKGTAKDPNDPRVAAAVKISLKCEALKIPQAMRAAHFTTQDSNDPNKQKWIRRRIQKSKSTQIASSIDIGSPGTIVSSITTPSSAQHQMVHLLLINVQNESNNVCHQQVSSRNVVMTRLSVPFIIMHINRQQKCMQKS